MNTVVEQSDKTKKTIGSLDNHPWNLAKVKQCERLLKNGFTPQQVGSKLCLSQAQIEELAFDVESDGLAVQVETYADWRRRKTEEIERKVVGICDKHLGAVAAYEGELYPETMGTVKDASQIAHLWLRKGEESGKSITHVNFQVLANAQPALGTGTGKVVEMEQAD